MSLLDDLRLAAGALDIQFQPVANETAAILGALVHFTEHGTAFLQAAEKGAEDVAKLLVPPPPEPPPAAPPAAAPVAGPDLASLQAQISDLQAQLAAREATAQQSTVTHQPGVA